MVSDSPASSRGDCGLSYLRVSEALTRKVSIVSPHYALTAFTDSHWKQRSRIPKSLGTFPFKPLQQPLDKPKLCEVSEIAARP
jgi:hypothetical protein